MVKKEYIEREAVENIFWEEQQELLKWKRYYQFEKDEKEEYDRLETYQDKIKSLPAADVAEVRHRKWVGENNMRLNLPTLLEYDDWYCSECGSYYPERHISRLSNYCPNCGAKMDGKEQYDESFEFV